MLMASRASFQQLDRLVLPMAMPLLPASSRRCKKKFAAHVHGERRGSAIWSDTRSHLLISSAFEPWGTSNNPPNCGPSLEACVSFTPTLKLDLVVSTSNSEMGENISSSDAARRQWWQLSWVISFAQDPRRSGGASCKIVYHLRKINEICSHDCIVNVKLFRRGIIPCPGKYALPCDS